VVWAVSLLTMKLVPHSLTGRLKSFPVFLVCKRLVPLSQPAPKQSFTPGKFIIYRCASTHFEENQLAPSSIGISPLTITHPSIFQHRSVRTSTSYHQSFILVVVRSPGFGSRRRDVLPYSDMLSLWLRLNILTCHVS
jgi:hypothetical protein